MLANDGNFIKGISKCSYCVWIDNPNGPDYKPVRVQTVGDGINLKELDFSKWQNRTRDYGKRLGYQTI